METTALLLVCSLLAAAPGETSSEGVKSDQTASGQAAAQEATPLAPVETQSAGDGEAEALVGRLADPSQIALPGAPTRLADLISRLIDRRQQIEATQTYWKLSAAVAEYRVCAESIGSLQQLQPAEGAPRSPGDAIVEARLAAAEARLRETEAEVLAEQYLLADLTRWAAPGALPLPADLPHVGPYDTKFQEIYGGRVPPPRAYLLDRSLPLRLRSLEMRAAAVTAATHAVEGDFDAFGRQQLDQVVVLDSIAELARQQRAFLVSVRYYNRDIAEYALSVAPANLSVARLVGLLIPPSDHTASQGEPGEGLRQAGFDEPLKDDRRGGPVRSSGLSGVPPRNEPTLAPPEAEAGEPGGVKVEPAAGEPAAGAQDAEPSEEQGAGEAPRADPFPPSASGAGKSGKGKRYETQKPLDSGAEGKTAEAPLGVYPALVDLPPPKRAQELGSTLHWSHQLPPSPGESVSLLGCLAWQAQGAHAGALVAAYWHARHRAARYQVLAQQVEQLQALDAAALAWRNRPDGAEAMLRLKTAQRGAEADLIEAELDLRIGQCLLAQVGGRSLAADWPLPATAPHAGRYRMKLELQPPQIAGLPKVQQLAATIPQWHAVLEQQSAAVLEADAARAAATGRFEQGASALGEPLAEIRQQAEETLAFLKVQNEYNLQIAEYVLTVLPPGIDRSTLAGALVIDRQAK
ncbi:MAG TPA: hypothetical protein VMV10_19420 [Pirellulales bacterium]|nr:hypothetical protein [Pirellulales bacterium]